MRRRAADYRRPVRRRFPQWIWALLAMFLMAALVLFVFHHHHRQDQINQPLEETLERTEPVNPEPLNFTTEILNPTSLARQLSQQITLAKAYVVIAKEHNNLHLAWELSNKIRTSQLLLSKSANQGHPITLAQAAPIITNLSHLIFKAQDTHYDISTTIATMKSHIQALEERANAATVQTTVFGQLSAEAVPKSLHCLQVKLTTDWLTNPTLHGLAEEIQDSPRVSDNNLYHFCVFSDNVLATSVVVNSTVSNAEHPKQIVFHVVTNRVTYGAMQAWFGINDFIGATVEVKNIEDMMVEPNLQNLRFYIPEIYPNLEKIVFLEDDVVVQKDLTQLFSLDLHGNVNGAVETCLESYHRYYKYLNFSNSIISSKIDPQSCVWALGMNVFDLIGWRKANVTARYRYWQGQNVDRTVWKLGTLAPALLAFYGLTEPLDRRWHVLGLGYDVNVDNRLIESAAVVHYNGNMKPWLKLAIARYKPLWERYVNQSHPYYRDCVTS